MRVCNNSHQRSMSKILEFQIKIISIILVVIDIAEPGFVSSNIVLAKSVKCIDHDLKFSKFLECQLKPYNRSIKLLTIRVALLQPPVIESKVVFRSLKKASGYRPFVINFDIDICKYFGGHVRNPVFDFIFAMARPFTNINHTCPYTSEMIIMKYPFGNLQLPSVFPAGEYRFEVQVGGNLKLRATVLMDLEVKEND